MDIPNVFWKYYDLYRRKLISLTDFALLTGLKVEQLDCYLRKISE